MFIGFDTEWHRDPKRPLRNVIIAYGLVLIVGDHLVELVVQPSGPARMQRLSLGRLVGLIIQKAVRRKCLKGWPKSVTVAVHYGRGDLAGCRGFELLKSKLSSVKGVLATKSAPLQLDVEIDDKCGIELDRLRPVPRALWLQALDSVGNSYPLNVRVLDTFCLAPEGASLDNLGLLLGYGKLALPDGYNPSDMGRFLAEQPEAFNRYLLRDAEITARYAVRYSSFCSSELGLKRPPATLGGAAVAVLLDTLKSNKLDALGLFGLVEVRKSSYVQAKRQRRTAKTRELTFAAKLVDRGAGDAYNGGRTETYLTGPVGGRLLRDIDLRSAYPTAMASLGVLDYANCKVVHGGDAGIFAADVAGIAEIKFVAPDFLRCPVFGVRTDRGLIFPRRGGTVATAPEIASALRLGVKVEIILGVVIPWDTTLRPYELFVIKMLNLRERLKIGGQDGLESLTVKVMTNSIYGKTAQGIRESTQFDTRTGGSKQLSRSAVTSPMYAAYTTGLVRAAVAELLNSIPKDEILVSCSTDGFLTSARLDDLSLEGPACQVLLAARRRISAATGTQARSDHGELLEVKKQAEEVVAFRNRGIATTAAAEGSKPILAKNGIKAPKGEDANHFILDLYLGRGHGMRIERRDLISLRDQMTKGADLVSLVRNPRVNFEPDMKRRLIGAWMARIAHGPFAGTEHIATESEPFDTAEDALRERAAFEGWRDTRQSVMKTLEDWLSWQDYRASLNARRRTGSTLKTTRGGSSDTLKRQFLRALVRGSWGVSLNGRTHEAVAAWLSEQGYQTRIEDVKNATRVASVLVEGLVAATDTSLELLKVLLVEFPSFDIDKAFAPDDLPRVRAALDAELAR